MYSSYDQLFILTNQEDIGKQSLKIIILDARTQGSKEFILTEFNFDDTFLDNGGINYKLGLMPRGFKTSFMIYDKHDTNPEGRADTQDIYFFAVANLGSSGKFSLDYFSSDFKDTF